MQISFDKNIRKLPQKVNACGKSILIGFCVLLVVSQIAAQDKSIKLVWTNLKTHYENFEEIDPIIELKEGDFILYKPEPLYNLLYRFDDKVERWVEGNYVVTDHSYGRIPGPRILKKGEHTSGAWGVRQCFEFEKGYGYFFISQNGKRYSVDGKYRITFFYGIDLAQPEKLNKFSHTPEFTIGKKTAANKLTCN